MRPPPDLIDGEEEYEVEHVLAKRRIRQRHQLQYLVKWKGYPDTDNQWINAQDMSADEAIAEFECSNSAPREHIRRVEVQSKLHHSSSGSCPSLGYRRESSKMSTLTSSQANHPTTSASASLTTSPPNIPVSTPVSATYTGAHFMTSNWEVHNPDAAHTNSSSDTSAGPAHASLTPTHYSLVLEDLGGPQSLGAHVPTPLPERGRPEAESSNSSHAFNPAETQMRASGAPIGASTPEENDEPLPIPPPSSQIPVSIATAEDDAEVQEAILHALMCIWATASTEDRGLFEDDLWDTEIVLGLANHLREAGYAPADA